MECFKCQARANWADSKTLAFLLSCLVVSFTKRSQGARRTAHRIQINNPWYAVHFNNKGVRVLQSVEITQSGRLRWAHA
jgi:hypothetical protein